MFNRNINCGGTNLHDTSEKGTTEPKGNEFYMMQFFFLRFHCEMKLIVTVMHF